MDWKWVRIWPKSESFRNFVKNSVWDPKRAKLNQNSDFGHVRTYSWLHKLRNTQGKIYGTYLGNICGIYKEYIRNIHKYLWYRIIRNTDYSLCIPYILHIYFLSMFHIFSLVCFLIYSVESRSGHERSQDFGSGSIPHFQIQTWLFEEISIWFCMDLCGEAKKTNCFI